MELKNLAYKGTTVTVEISELCDPVDAFFESGHYDWPAVDLTDAELAELTEIYSAEIHQAVMQEAAETAHDRWEMSQER